MNVKGACLTCRGRKVKCNPGPAQRCERCMSMGLEVCVYKQIKKRGIGKTLRMGEACKRCRARKRKCDAKQPCTTCVDANRAPECEYESAGDQPRLLGRSQFLFWNGFYPSKSRDSFQGRWAAREAVPESPANQPVATVTQFLPEAAPPAPALIRTLTCGGLSPGAPPEPQPCSIDESRTAWITLPPSSVLFTLMFPSIIPEPHFTLSFLGAERLQLSDVALGGLDMKFRLRVVCKLSKLGIRFIPQKQRALVDGDTSGAVLNPFFIFAAQSMGMHLCEGMDNSPAMIRLQARHVQRSLELLAEVFGGRDSELKAQVALWVAAGSLVMRLSTLTHPYIEKACAAVNAAGLQFIPTYGRPPEYTEDLHERLSVLSQIIYFENFLFLTCGGVNPTMTERIEEEFRSRLQDVYPVLFKICPLTMRTQNILLVRDTVVALDLRPTDGDEFQAGIWRQSCDRLVTLLDTYSQTLLSNLRRFEELRDNGGAWMIRSSYVSCLAHLAVLCQALGDAEPAPQASLDTLCDSTLERLGELAQSMCMEEYTRLDLLLKLSWKKALGVFDARLAKNTLTNLRHWREIVAGVCSDFEANIPDPGPGPLIMRAWSVDGRTEGSRYPNLMIPGAGKQYGIS